MHLAFVRHALAAALLTAASCFAAQPVATPAAPARANASSTASIRMPASNPHAQASPVVPAPPSQTLGELYRAVELAHVFPDGKTFADRVPKEDPARIAAAYEAARGQPGFDLRKFVDARFAAPRHEVRQYVSDPKQTVVAHIDTLWDVLRRDPDSVASFNFYTQPGTAVVASSGDSGYLRTPNDQGTIIQEIAFPAANPTVVAVGGTTLRASTSTRGWAETAWRGAGSGCSKTQTKPIPQRRIASAIGSAPETR